MELTLIDELMSPDFHEIMSKKTNSELVKILSLEKDQFQPNALVAAEEELNKRNLSFDQITYLNKENEITQQENEARANEPLGIFWKLLAFFIPGLTALAFSGSFKADGYEKKARDMARWTLYGVGFYIVLIVILKSL